MAEKDFSKVRVRNAPSPTGRPHIGTAYNALFNYVFARKHGGKFILRIEDTDRERYVPGSEEEMSEALSWLGLEPDESPQKGGPFGPYRQSERLEIYQKYAEELVEKGAAYYCFCSEERLEEMRKRCRDRKEPPMYDGCCRELGPREAKERAEADESYVIRLKVPREGVTKFHDLIRGEIEVENRVIDDQILLKSDGFPTYHLANVVDDHLMEITHIIRGEEWLSSVPKHVLLYQSFGWEIPVYAHTPLLRGKDKSKLGKRHGALPVLDYHEQGFLPEALLNYIALLGWTHPEEKDFFDLDEMIEKFELEDLNTTAPVFDPEKMEWLNGVYSRDKDKAGMSMNYDKQTSSIQLGSEKFKVSGAPSSPMPTTVSGLTLDILPYFEKAGLVDRRNPDELIKITETAGLVADRIRRLPEAVEVGGYLHERPQPSLEALVQKGRAREEVKEMLGVAVEILGEGNFDGDYLEKEFRAKAEEHGWKMGELCMTVRVAITGKTASPPLFESMKILGKDEVLVRLEAAAKVL